MNDADFIKFVALILIGGSLLLVAIFGEYLLRCRKQKEESDEITHHELTEYDELPSGVAVSMAWDEANAKTRTEVREIMPRLARNLDRFTQD